MIHTKKEQYTIYNMSCLDLMDSLEENSVDAIVTDPPYEIGFMNKGWDNTGIAFSVETWKKALRVLKKGGYLLAFNHSRTFHRMMVAIEDAGFELRDTMMWLYGSGFPKSHNIAKAIDRTYGIKHTNHKETNNFESGNLEEFYKRKKEYKKENDLPIQTPQAKQWDGYGTALKPAFEPIVMARKPFNTSVAENVLTYGVGGINIDECRIKGEWKGKKRTNSPDKKQVYGVYGKVQTEQHVNGRFPANVIHDGSKEATRDMWDWETDNDASRYFYCAKASVKDRDEGLEFTNIPLQRRSGQQGADNDKEILDDVSSRFRTLPKRNIHPTVKPTELMQYLVRLVTPKGGTVLDIFMGSGSTGKATMIENVERDADYHFIGVDLEKEYCDIAEARINYGLNYKEIEARQNELIETFNENGEKVTVKQESLF